MGLLGVSAYERSQASENMEMQYMDGTRVDFVDLAPGSVVAREGEWGSRVEEIRGSKQHFVICSVVT